MALATPRLDTLLTRLRAALVRSVWLHGVGTVVAVAGGWLLLAFLLDRFLHVPALVRILHTGVLIALPLWFLARALLRPLRRVPDRDGLAVLADRARGADDDLFVSAVQLAGRPPGPGTPLVERVLREAEQVVDGVNLEPVLDTRTPRKRAALGLGLSALAAGVLGAQPQMANIFFQRMLGGDVPWPQRTQLYVEVPLPEDRGTVNVGTDEIVVRAARGVDVPILVRAEGEVPREVFLEFEGGQENAVSSGGGKLFRTVLRSVQQDMAFRVTGSDDNDGEPLVRIEVLQPPDVAGLAFAVTPPAYTGRKPRLVHATEVEVLEGSGVRVHVLPDPPEARGRALLFPEDVSKELSEAPFPPRAGDEGPLVDGLAFDLVPGASLRFSLALLDASNLPNPDPGLFGITVREDRRPELMVLAPSRAELDVVSGGAVPLRLRVEDDYGVALLSWDVRAPEVPETTLAEGVLELENTTSVDESTLAGRDVRRSATRLEVDDLGGAELLAEGSRLLLQVVARDNREPVANEAQSSPIRLRVISGSEYHRKLKDDLAQAGERAGVLSADIQTAEVELRELLGVLAGDGSSSEGSGAGELAYGARRIAGDSLSLGRELAGLAEGLIYSRLDDRAGGVLEALDFALAQEAERGFRPDPWRALARDHAEGLLGSPQLAGDMVQLVGLALEISQQHAADMTLALESATPSNEREAVETALEAVSAARLAAEELVTLLGEWDNFQSVLTLTRDILKRQMNLTERTKKYAEDH